MKNIDLGQTITILANVGVIAGIMFLAVEIRQGNALLASEARTSRAEMRRGYFERIIENEGLVSLIAKAEEGQPLSAEETIVLNAHYHYVFTGWQLAFEDARAGLIEEENLPIRAWRAFLQSEPGMAEFLRSVAEAGAYRPEFVEWVDQAP